MSVLVSVICNTYNHEEFIEQCILSIVTQKTNFDFELLIHDDASTDRTAEIIRKYEVKYPHIMIPIYQEINQYSKGINNWVAYQFPRAKGKYIALCDGDDYWIDANKLQRQVDIMESHLGCSYCFHNSLILSEENKSYTKKSISTKKQVLGIKEFRSCVLVATSSVLLRNYQNQEYLKPLIELTHSHGDFLLFCSLLTFGKVAFIDEYMSVYRKHSFGICYDQYSEEYLRNRIIELKIEASYFKNSMISREIRRIIVNREVLYLNNYMNKSFDNRIFCLSIKNDLKKKPYYYLHISYLFIRKVVDKLKSILKK